MKTSLSLKHFLLALAVVAVWGTNFVVNKLALGHMPPLMFATLRFAVVVVPAVLFVPRPAVGWRNLAAYGLLIGVGQFGLLFVAMNGHISPGLASLVIQVQVFFTIGLAMMLAGESLQRVQWVALALGAAGLGLIALAAALSGACFALGAAGLGLIVTHTDGSTTPLGLGLILLAALSWAGGNLVSRAAGRINMVAYVVWSSLFAVPPLFALSLWVEGWPAMQAGALQADVSTWAAVVWQAVGNSLFGYAAWGWLLARYSAGMGGSALWLGEPLPAWKLLAAGLVLSGLALNLLWPWWLQRRFSEPLR